MSFEKRVNNMIGMPYSDKNHCYALVMELLPNAPKVDFIADSIFKSIRQIEHTKIEYNLLEVEDYKDEDIILLGRDGIFHHVGVYYAGGIIHADKVRGVVYDDIKQLRRFYSNIKGLRI